MGILTIVNTCSHLQNASLARLGLTSIPHTKSNLHLALALHRAGYLSSVTRGGPHPPDPSSTEAPEPITHANVATRRLWLGMKYFRDKPVLSKVKIVSSPKRKVHLSLRGLERLVRGRPDGTFEGLTLGESLFVATDQGVLEAREAIGKRRGGVALCRVS